MFFLVPLFLLVFVFQGLAYSSQGLWVDKSNYDYTFDQLGEEIDHGIDGSKSIIFEFDFTNTQAVDISVEDPETQMYYLVDFSETSNGITLYINQKYIGLSYSHTNKASYFNTHSYDFDYDMGYGHYGPDGDGRPGRIDFAHGMGSQITADMDSIYFGFLKFHDVGDLHPYPNDDIYEVSAFLTWGGPEVYVADYEIDVPEDQLPSYEFEDFLFIDDFSGDSMIGGKAGTFVDDADDFSDGGNFYQQDNASAALYGIASDHGSELGDNFMDYIGFEESDVIIVNAIPEPRFYALFTGILSLGLVVYKRRKKE